MPKAPRETSPPKTCSTCCTAWRSKPASIWMRWSKRDASFPLISTDPPCRRSRARWKGAPTDDRKESRRNRSGSDTFPCPGHGPRRGGGSGATRGSTVDGGGRTAEKQEEGGRGKKKG